MGTPLPDGREGEEWPVSTAGLTGKINNGNANSIALLPKSKTHNRPGERKKGGLHQASPMAGDGTCSHIINCFLVVFVCLFPCFYKNLFSPQEFRLNFFRPQEWKSLVHFESNLCSQSLSMKPKPAVI